MVITVDPAVTLCSATACRAADEGGWLYMDNYHLNPRGSLLLKPDLVRAFGLTLSPGK